MDRSQFPLTILPLCCIVTSRALLTCSGGRKLRQLQPARVSGGSSRGTENLDPGLRPREQCGRRAGSLLVFVSKLACRGESAHSVTRPGGLTSFDSFVDSPEKYQQHALCAQQRFQFPPPPQKKKKKKMKCRGRLVRNFFVYLN